REAAARANDLVWIQASGGEDGPDQHRKLSRVRRWLARHQQFSLRHVAGFLPSRSGEDLVIDGQPDTGGVARPGGRSVIREMEHCPTGSAIFEPTDDPALGPPLPV